MMDTTPFAVSNLLTSLLDRPVQVIRTDEVTFSPHTRFATYLYEPDQSAILVRIDLKTLAGLAGLLIGMPATQTEAMASKGQLDEDLLDAAREVMNIVSSVVVSEGRAIFRQLYDTEATLPAEARALQRLSSLLRMSLKCSISGKPVGCMSILFPY